MNKNLDQHKAWNNISMNGGEEEELKRKVKVCKKCIANQASLRYAGPYLLGPLLESSPVKSITQCLARKMGTNKFFMLKLLTMCSDRNYSQDIKQGKMLIHTEFSLLSLLAKHEGVVQVHGLFQDEVEQKPHINKNNNIEKPQICKRLCLVLDCLTATDYNPNEYMNLQSYLIKHKILPEKEAITIFLDVVKVVQMLHQKNIIHRDLKLGNIVLNVSTKQITLTNFCLGKQLIRDDELLTDRRGSPAYTSPDILTGSPYSGKASDMWSLGVVLYALLFGQFPFYDNVPQELFRKIKLAQYHIPNNHGVSDGAVVLIHRLLTADSKRRATATDIVHHVQGIINSLHLTSILGIDTQIVPDVERRKRELSDDPSTTFTSSLSDSVIDIQTPAGVRTPAVNRYVHTPRLYDDVPTASYTPLRGQAAGNCNRGRTLLGGR